MTRPRSSGILRRGLRAARDVAERVKEAFTRDRSSPPLPPAYLRDVGPGDFEAIGREFLGHFRSLGSLRPSETVLEVGCGPGRMAIALTNFLSEEGRYTGIDVVSRSVAWCQRNLSRRYPNFSFHHVDIFNQRYNPRGTIPADQYRFPYADHSFDFIFLTSVFTHMYPRDTQHYLHEIARMLRPDGRVFSTFFLLNDEQRVLSESGRNQVDFVFEGSGFRLRDEAIPESAIAVEETAVRAMFERAGLTIQDPIRFGSWSGREDGLSFQDIVLAKPAVP